MKSDEQTETIESINWAMEAIARFDRARLTNLDGTVNLDAYTELDWLTRYLERAKDRLGLSAINVDSKWD